jgi:hypothetical protein
LSVSYYELAESLENESSYDNAIFQYSYSDLIAGMVRLTGDIDTYSSRYSGNPEVILKGDSQGLSFDMFNDDFSLILIGCVIGLGVSMIVFISVWSGILKK